MFFFIQILAVVWSIVLLMSEIAIFMNFNSLTEEKKEEKAEEYKTSKQTLVFGHVARLVFDIMMFLACLIILWGKDYPLHVKLENPQAVKILVTRPQDFHGQCGDPSEDVTETVSE